jgi:F-type H+-transporting ATPase subunit delta
MAELNTIARPYAKAVFQYAQESNALEHWETMLKLVAAVVQEPTMRAALDNPARSAEQCADLVAEVCGDELDDKARNLITQLAWNKRLTALPEIARLFHELVAAQQRFRDVEVVSAYELEGGEADKLAEALRKRLALDVNVSGRVDESLIGGVVVRAGDTVIDGSVRGRLDRLAERLNSRV